MNPRLKGILLRTSPLLYSRRRGEVNVRIAMPNPKPAISPSTTKGHGESPVKNQYRKQMSALKAVIAAVAMSNSSRIGFMS